MRLITVAAMVAIAGCGGNATSKIPQNPAKAAPPGTFSVLWISDYSNANPSYVGESVQKVV